MDGSRQARTFRGEPSDAAASLAVIFSSILVGLIIVWTLVRAMVPDAAPWTLLARYSAYAIIIAVLYSVRDYEAVGARMGFAPLSGFSAAACTAGPYLQFCSVSATVLLFGVVLFWVVWAAVFCLGLSGEGLEREMTRLLGVLSEDVLVVTTAILTGFLAVAVHGLFVG